MSNFGPCIQRIVTEGGAVLQCESTRFHPSMTHEAHDKTHIYRWRLVSYPIGWRSDIGKPGASYIEDPGDPAK